MIAKTVGITLVSLGALLVAYEVWMVAPVIVIACLLFVVGCAIVVLLEARGRIKGQRERMEHLHEELRARQVDDEVEMDEGVA